jgi:hypothetical protein
MSSSLMQIRIVEVTMVSTRCIAAALIVLLGGFWVSPGWAQDPPRTSPPGPDATAAAVVGDFFYVPGKAIVCGMSGVLYVATMALTFGALYQEATDFVRGGCGGKWVLTGEDIKPPAERY